MWRDYKSLTSCVVRENSIKLLKSFLTLSLILKTETFYVQPGAGEGVSLNIVGGGMPLSSWNPCTIPHNRVLKPEGGPWSPGAPKFLPRSPEPGARSPEPGAQSPEPGARSPEPKTFLYFGARTKIMISAKWSSRVQPWSPRPPIFPTWSPGALQFLARNPEALGPFGILTLCSAALGNYFRLETPKLPILSETPDIRPKCFDFYSRPQSKQVKNHTFHNRLAH